MFECAANLIISTPDVVSEEEEEDDKIPTTGRYSLRKRSSVYRSS